MGKIKDLPFLERPREKAIRYGINALSSAELLAIIIGSGTKEKSALDIANELISKHNGITNLMRVSQENLQDVKGVSTVGSLKIASCFELAKKIINNDDELSKNITESLSQISLKYSLMLRNETQEQLYLICLTNNGVILKEKMLFLGTEKMASVSTNEVLKEALISRCKNIVLIHNHPNGTPVASYHDILFTSNLAKECKRFDLCVYDHLIIAGSQIVSLYKKLP